MLAERIIAQGTAEPQERRLRKEGGENIYNVHKQTVTERLQLMGDYRLQLCCRTF